MVWDENTESEKMTPKDFKIEATNQMQSIEEPFMNPCNSVTTDAKDNGLTQKLFSTKLVKWYTIGDFKNHRVQRQIGKTKWAYFPLVKPIDTRFARICFKNNLGNPYHIRVQRIDFD